MKMCLKCGLSNSSCVMSNIHLQTNVQFWRVDFLCNERIFALNGNRWNDEPVSSPWELPSPQLAVKSRAEKDDSSKCFRNATGWTSLVRLGTHNSTEASVTRDALFRCGLITHSDYLLTCRLACSALRLYSMKACYCFVVLHAAWWVCSYSQNTSPAKQTDIRVSPAFLNTFQICASTHPVI